MPNQGNEHWTLPQQPRPAATRGDYYILFALIVFVVAVLAICCGFGAYMGKVLFT